jgi:hypothetical protein
MAETVYIVCAVTSLLCSVLLLKRYGQSRSGLLLWSGVAFLCLTVAGILLFVDLVIVRQVDLMMYRNLATLAGVLVLLSALIADTWRKR